MVVDIANRESRPPRLPPPARVLTCAHTAPARRRPPRYATRAFSCPDAPAHRSPTPTLPPGQSPRLVRRVTCPPRAAARCPIYELTLECWTCSINIRDVRLLLTPERSAFADWGVRARFPPPAPFLFGVAGVGVWQDHVAQLQCFCRPGRRESRFPIFFRDIAFRRS